MPILPRSRVGEEMSGTIQERLRLWSGTSWVPESELDLQNEAADEIDRLNKRIEELTQEKVFRKMEFKSSIDRIAELESVGTVVLMCSNGHKWLGRAMSEECPWCRSEELRVANLTVFSKAYRLGVSKSEVEDIHIITTEQSPAGPDNRVVLDYAQIDEMWRHTRPKGISAADQFFADGALAAIAEADIVACEECGGSGVEDGMTVMAFCHDCGSHGWTLKPPPKVHRLEGGDDES